MGEKSSRVKSCVVSLKELVCGKIVDQNDQKSEIFSKDRFSLNIPDYQRPYTWEIEQVKILLKDISEQVNKNDQKYLLGSLILHKNNENKFNIVDGQQRLTTLALILKVLCENNQEKCNEYKMGNFLGEIKYSHNESKYHIKENYEYIKTYFESYNEKYKFLTYLLDNIEFICVLAPSEDDAFLFFDSANSKGKALKSYDLIKAFHLHSLKKRQKNYAMFFENLAKDEKKITILFDELLAPARAWLKHKSINANKIEAYDEFCKEFFSDKFLYSRENLGILNSFANGDDFFKYLYKYNKYFNKAIKQNQIYESLNIDTFLYCRSIYIIASMIYFSKFPNGNSDYFLLLLARAAFGPRFYNVNITRSIQRDYALEFLKIVYFVSFEEELKQNLLDFIQEKIILEKEFYEKNENMLDKAKRMYYLNIIEDKYKEKNIPLHYVKYEEDKGVNNE
ncbi:DUF262 domain-containing protein [Campylobacter coli]|nr:DUF262 domain-containing protein [Campylobacter coli]EAJ7022271.1 DUF262 domain-containing protein [Campylobacter coli]ELJ5538566.1 DUF262 domain-containing protein [Campylobacter coli]MPB38378.1 DUF262 domain-containing protein [Campylobacter coli]HEH5472017.1 DUF262 domain-containing protein [Campylobacter coli]